MNPYLNKITLGNNLDITPKLPDNSIDAILIDPPYGESQEYYGDDGITNAREGLSRFLECANPKLKQNGHIAIFWTMRNVDVCIEVVKSLFTFRRVLSMYIPKGNARPYLGWLPRTQAIVIAQKYVPGQPTDFHYELSTYLNQKLKESGLKRSELAKILGCNSRLVMKWTRPGDPSYCLPTPRFYPQLKKLLNLDDRYDLLYDRKDIHKENRKDFKYKHDCYIVEESKEDVGHPAQKPLSVVSHLVSCICPTDGVVLDGFCGSGTTAVACKMNNRNFICFEISKEFYDIANARLESL